MKTKELHCIFSPWFFFFFYFSALYNSHVFMIAELQKYLRVKPNNDIDDDGGDEQKEEPNTDLEFLVPEFWVLLSVFEVCLYDMLFFDLEALSVWVDSITWFCLKMFEFETVLYCPLTHRYLCACCFGGQGNGDKTNL